VSVTAWRLWPWRSAACGSTQPKQPLAAMNLPRRLREPAAPSKRSPFWLLRPAEPFATLHQKLTATVCGDTELTRASHRRVDAFRKRTDTRCILAGQTLRQEQPALVEKPHLPAVPAGDSHQQRRSSLGEVVVPANQGSEAANRARVFDTWWCRVGLRHSRMEVRREVHEGPVGPWCGVTQLRVSSKGRCRKELLAGGSPPLAHGACSPVSTTIREIPKDLYLEVLALHRQQA